MPAWKVPPPHREVCAQPAREVVTDASSSEIEALLGLANEDTRRLPYVIETFTTDPPTLWSDAHAYLNDLLDDWEQARATGQGAEQAKA